MNNNLNRHVASDKVKWIAVTLAILLIGVALAAALTNGFKTANPYCWLGHTYEKGSTVCSVCGEECKHKDWKDGKCKDCGFACEHDYLNGKCKICGEKESEPRENSLEVTPYKSSGIKLLSAPVPRASGSAKESLQLTATLSPADAKECAVDWDVSWAQENSGKIVTDYVTITPTTDGALTATLSYLQVFDKQIIVKVELRDNSDINATATVDCIGEFSYSIISGDSLPNNNYLSLSGGSLARFSFPWKIPTYDNGIGQKTSLQNFDNNAFNSVKPFGVKLIRTGGTIPFVFGGGSFTVFCTDSLKQELSKVFSTYSSSYSAERTYSIASTVNSGDNNCYNIYFDFPYLFVPANGRTNNWYETEGLFSFCSDEVDDGEWKLNSEKFNQLKQCLKNNSSSSDLTFKVSFSLHSSNREKELSFTKNFSIDISDSSLETLATDVSLSQNSVIF